MDDVYAVKKTTFLGKPVLVICQNINGPCPLLAICNVLLLRGHLAIDTFVSPDGLISAHDLMRVVQSRLVSTNPLVPGSSDLAHLTREKTLQDVIALLPSLLVGLDVNVRFHKITDFEYTVECAVFDMLDIALVHGWLLDAQDASTLRVVQNKSYNELVAHLVEYRSVLMTENSTSGDGDDSTPSATDASASSVEAQDAAAGAASPSAVALPPAASEADTAAATASPPQFITPDATDFKRLAIDTRASEQPCASPASSVSGSPSQRKRSPSKQTVQVMMQERAMSDADAVSTATVLLEDGPVLEEFFASSASQLTYYGLVKLHEEVRERQLCVFFRNNHFSTLFKFDGSLYLLVTDAGYLDEPSVVWERLNEIDGDSEYVDANFRTLNVSETNQQSILTRQEEAKQRALLAQAQDATLSSAAPGSSERAGAATSAPSNGCDDPDYLYALQLQQEEEARAKRVSPAISPRRQPSPVSRQAPAPAPITAAAAMDEDARSSRDNSSSSYDRDESSSASQFDDASAGLGRTGGAVDPDDVLPAISADGELLLSAQELEAQRQAERFYQERKRQHDQQTHQFQHHHQQQQMQQQRSRDTSARSGRQSKGDGNDCSVM